MHKRVFLLLIFLLVSGTAVTAAGLDPGYDPRAQEVIVNLFMRNKIDPEMNSDLSSFCRKAPPECRNAPFTCTYECEGGRKCDFLSLAWSDEAAPGRKQLVGLEMDSFVPWFGDADISGLPFLKRLVMPIEYFTSLDLRGNTALEFLVVRSDKLRLLDLSSNPGLKTVISCNSALHEIELGANQLKRLEEVALANNRLPLSQLAKFSGRADVAAVFGMQENVFFEHRTFKRVSEATLDFSAEVAVAGHPTDFRVTDEHGQAIEDGDIYTENRGVITFRKPGRYRVLMTNPAVPACTRKKADSASSLCTPCDEFEPGPTRVYSGIVEIAG